MPARLAQDPGHAIAAVASAADDEGRAVAIAAGAVSVCAAHDAGMPSIVVAGPAAAAAWNGAGRQARRRGAGRPDRAEHPAGRGADAPT